jgi:hypothetical protein
MFVPLLLLQAVAYEFNAPFSTVLAQRMTYFNNDPGADVIDRVRGEISQVRGVVFHGLMLLTVHNTRSRRCWFKFRSLLYLAGEMRGCHVV